MFASSPRGRAPGPWTNAGEPDPEFGAEQRHVHHMALTDEGLLVTFAERFPNRRVPEYDELVRLLGYVWDCPVDHAANVTGHCCARCGRTHASARAMTLSH